VLNPIYHVFHFLLLKFITLINVGPIYSDLASSSSNWIGTILMNL